MRKLSLSIDTSIHEASVGCSPRGVSQDPAEIVANVYIGSVDVAKDSDRICEAGIQAVVDASKAAYRLASSVPRLRIEVEDSPDANLAAHFHKTSRFIEEHVQQGLRVLVHCRAGISRSAAIVIAYLIYSGSKPTLREAYRHTRSQKPNVHPNLGFFRQLQEWEREITGESSMTVAEYYEEMFAPHGFSKQHVQGVVQQVGTDNYQAVVAMLHSRENSLALETPTDTGSEATPYSGAAD